MWWERRSASTAARCAASRCWRSSSASRLAKYSSRSCSACRASLSGRRVGFELQAVASRRIVRLRRHGGGRLAAVTVAWPAEHGIYHMPVLERDDILGAARVLARVTEKEIRPLSLAPHRHWRAPQRVDVVLAHPRRDGARVR